jgi:hypothetical protein
MNKYFTFLAMLLLALLPGCEAIKGIFHAGVWVGALLVIGVIVLIFWLIGGAGKK